MKHVTTIMAAATLILAGCSQATQQARYLLVRDTYTLDTPGRIVEKVSRLEAVQQGAALYPSSTDLSLEAKGQVTRQVMHCRLVDRRTGRWVEVHCPADDVQLGQQVSTRDRRRPWRRHLPASAVDIGLQPARCEE